MWDEPELYYDRQGRPIPMLEWAKLHQNRYEDDSYRRIGSTQVTKDIWVSTVWIGLDHSFWGGPPLIFETMVFGGPDNEEMERYSTEAQALAGHDQWVARERRLVGLERWWR